MPPRSGGAWTVTFEGERLAAVPGESLAATLLVAGHVAQGMGKDGTPRGVFCGMGVCHECLVVVDGRAGIRACMTKARDGMTIARQPVRPAPQNSSLTALAQPPETIPETAIDLLVVGAGPAGLAAAESAAAAGASVLVLDERPAAGGQFYKQPATAATEEARDAQASEGATLIARVRDLGVVVLAETLVWGVERADDGSLTVGCLVASEARRLRPRALVIATGAVEQAPILPGWTLPGVMTTGALQTLVRSDGVAPGRRILIAGNGPLNLQVAAELLAQGATLAAVIEAAPAPWTRPAEAAALVRAAPALAGAGLRHLAVLMRAGVPILWNTHVRRIDGPVRAERVIVARLDRPDDGRIFDADLVAIGEGFWPANELSRLLGCRHEPDGHGGLTPSRASTNGLKSDGIDAGSPSPRERLRHSHVSAGHLHFPSPLWRGARGEGWRAWVFDRGKRGDSLRDPHPHPLSTRERGDGGIAAIDVERLRSVQRDPYGTTSLPDVFVAGEAGRFGGARIALTQGALAGRAAARRLGLPVMGDDATLLRRLARQTTFQEALWSLFQAPQPGLSRVEDNTILCRCEAITLETLKTAITENGITDLSTLKRLTRAGMGRCQGRACTASLSALIGIAAPDERAGFAPQMPLRPIPIAALAVEKPEWGGHKRSLLPDWRPTGASEGPFGGQTADIVVIGAGIAGLSTALFLARAGHDVLVVDRSHPNALASGGNAGSLHAQLLSFDHGARAEAGGGPAARTLPLQRDSIALWMELEREARRDFEIKVTGGLMVAETERDLAFLAKKTRIERSHGIECDVIGAADLRRLEPALSDGFVGAAYCPQEGKINPLVATQGILDLAVAAGARLLRHAEVRAITRAGAAFEIETSRGRIVAPRVVNAAGAFASTVGRMLGVEVPVFGAPLQMIVTEAAAPTISCLVAHADRHLTLKQAANGNFLIGGGWTAGLDPVHGHPRPLMASLEGNLWVAQHVVPALRKLHVIRSWAAMNINIDGAPILGEDPRVPGLFHAVTSNGYTLGPLVGRITAQLIGHGAAERDVSAFSITRFARAA